MKILKSNLVVIFLILSPFFCFADNYPINKDIDIKHYAFEFDLSDATDEIFGKASITVLFKSADIKSFRLDLVNKNPEIEHRGMEVKSIVMKGVPLKYTHQNNALFIYLNTPLAINSEAIFEIEYHGTPIEGLKIGPTKHKDRSFFSENWPNKARNWLPTYDHPSDKATSEFIVRAPSHYKVISNGLLLEESDLGNNIRLTHWKQSVPVSCWLFVLGVADFAVKYVDKFEGKSIESWVYSKDRVAGFYDFDEPTKKVLEFFSSYVGPFAYEKLANIQSVNSGGGMETSSAIFYSDKFITGKRSVVIRDIVIHEIAHQWFGNAVTEANWDDAWLSEGFATYFTMLFIENEYGKQAYEKEIQKAKESTFRETAKMPNFSIVSPRSAEKEDVTAWLTYQKGAWVLHMLRDKMGEANFKKGIQAYYGKYFNAHATTDDFREEMEKVSGQNLKMFFNQWLYQPVNPSIQGTWHFDSSLKKLTIQLTQNQDFIFELPLEIGYFSKNENKPTILKIDLNQKQKIQTFDLDTEPIHVVFDPRNVLLSENSFKKGNE